MWKPLMGWGPFLMGTSASEQRGVPSLLTLSCPFLSPTRALHTDLPKHGGAWELAWVCPLPTPCWDHPLTPRPQACAVPDGTPTLHWPPFCPPAHHPGGDKRGPLST
jgi:hypothetical protein